MTDYREYDNDPIDDSWTDYDYSLNTGEDTGDDYAYDNSTPHYGSFGQPCENKKEDKPFSLKKYIIKKLKESIPHILAAIALVLICVLLYWFLIFLNYLCSFLV